MKNPLVLSLLALLVSALGLTYVFLSPPAAAGGRAEAEAEWLEALEGLTQEVRAMRERIDEIDNRPAPPVVAAPQTQRMPALEGFATKEDLASLRAEWLGSAGEVQGGDVASLPNGLEGHVVEALEKIRRDEAVEKALAGFAKRTERVEERVAGWSKWLDLDEYQQMQLTDLMNARDQREREYLEAWSKGASEERLATLRNGFQGDYVRDVRLILSPTQLETMSSKFGDGSDGR